MKIEIREDGSVLLEGYINVTSRESKVLTDKFGTRFIEVIEPKCFERALAKNDKVLMLRDHNWDCKIGTVNDNVELFEDNIGLFYRANINDLETVELAKANKLSGCSFGFTSPKFKSKNENGLEKRYVSDLNLLEVSILSDSKSPAYSGCSVYTRDVENENIDIEVREFNNPTELKNEFEHDSNVEMQDKRNVEIQKNTEIEVDYSVLKNTIWLLKNK